MTFEIKDEEIDVQKIMERIRENIKKRRQQSGYSEAQVLLEEPGFQQQISAVQHDELRKNLHEANIGYQVQVRRPILSYRPLIGRLLVRIRRILQQEIRWTLDPIVDRQESFNAVVVRCLNAMVEQTETKLAELEKRIEETQSRSTQQTETKLAELEKRIDRGMTDSELISLVYKVFLDRDVDAAGLTSYSQLLASGGNVADIVADIVRSPEFLHLTERSVEVPWCLARIGNARKVLDVGCADSSYLELLGHLELYGVDSRDPSVRVPRNFHFIKGDITQDIMPHKFFDLVICISTLEHIGLEAYGMKTVRNGDRLALDMMLGSLGENGRLLVTVPFGRRATHGWLRVYDESEWRHLIKGFKIAEESYFKWNGRHYESCSMSMLSDTDYIHPESPLGKAGGIVCAELLKASRRSERSRPRSVD